MTDHQRARRRPTPAFLQHAGRAADETQHEALGGGGRGHAVIGQRRARACGGRRVNFQTLEELIAATAAGVRPPERLTVAQAAEKYRYLNNPGSYVGYWDNTIAPYLVEPMEVLTSLDHTGMIFAGPARTGKALALDTPIPTPTGWTTMGELNVGDLVLDRKSTRLNSSHVAI